MDRRRKGPAYPAEWGGADMQPTVQIEEGSPVTIRRITNGMSGTADEQSVSGNIKTADDAGRTIHAGPVPIYLVPATISAEIHEHGANIVEITIRRIKHHNFVITLTRTGSQGETEETAKTAETAETAGDADAA